MQLGICHTAACLQRHPQINRKTYGCLWRMASRSTPRAVVSQTTSGADWQMPASFHTAASDSMTLLRFIYVAQCFSAQSSCGQSIFLLPPRSQLDSPHFISLAAAYLVLGGSENMECLRPPETGLKSTDLAHSHTCIFYAPLVCSVWTV